LRSAIGCGLRLFPRCNGWVDGGPYEQLLVPWGFGDSPPSAQSAGEGGPSLVGIPHPEQEPQHLLERFFREKGREVAAARERLPLETLQRQHRVLPPTRDFVAALRADCRKPAVLAVIKKASPKKA
jgi:hypothetical protein